MNLIQFFKREKLKQKMPNPNFKDNWKQELFEKNVKEGVISLQNGRSIVIYDDGRGYELAIRIKNEFILEYQKQLSQKIIIEGNNLITISLKK